MRAVLLIGAAGGIVSLALLAVMFLSPPVFLLLWPCS